MSYLMGIDAGTTALKVTVFDTAGNMIANSSEEYSLIISGSDRVELNALDYWHTCVRGIQKVLQSSSIEAEAIQALSVSSQGESFVPVGKEGKPVMNAIVESDDRSIEEARELESVFTEQTIYEKTGQPHVFTSWPATKILWLKKNAPGIFKKVYKYLLIEDYLIYLLTGEYVCEPSLICSTLVYDLKGKDWWEEMMNFLEIGPEHMGTLLDSGKVAGTVQKTAAEETGLSRNTLVVMGALDQAAAMIGCGNIKPGVINESTGTVLAICATLQGYKLDEQRRLPIHAHAVPDTYYTFPWCRTAGAVLKWFRDIFCEEETQEAEKKGLSSYAALSDAAAEIEPGSGNLITVPNLLGALYPDFNPLARGVFFGVSLQHTKAHFVRSIMEGVAFLLRSNMEVMQGFGIEINAIRSLGGASNSTLWNQIKADVTNVPILLLENSDVAASLGAALLAGVAAGVYTSFDEACNATVRVGSTIEPDRANSSRYEPVFQTYKELQRTVDHVWAARSIE